jgi:hypothetical protein
MRWGVCVCEEVSPEDVAKRMTVVEEWIAHHTFDDQRCPVSIGEPRGTTLVMEFVWEDWKDTLQNIYASLTDFKFVTPRYAMSMV